MATDLPVSTPAKALDQVADQRVASGEAPAQVSPHRETYDDHV